MELKFRLFDNGGKTADRYTLITEKGDVYGFSENPSHPQGFGCFSHTIDVGNPIGYYKKCVAPYCNETEIHINVLSPEARSFVLYRIDDGIKCDVCSEEG